MSALCDVDGVSVDAYGNVVDTEGYLIDQSDGTSRLSLTSGSEIVAQTSAVATDSAGASVTVVSGDGYVFETVDSDAGTVYVSVTAVDATYYDYYGNQVDDTGSYLVDSDGNQLIESDVSEGTYVLVPDDATASTPSTYYSYEAETATNGSYYAVVSGSVTQMYIDGTQIADDNYVVSDGNTYYLLSGETTSDTYYLLSATTGTSWTQSITAGSIVSIFDSASASNISYSDTTYLYYSATAEGVTYYIYYGTVTSGSSGLSRDASSTVPVTIGSTVYYFSSSTSTSDVYSLAKILTAAGYSAASLLVTEDASTATLGQSASYLFVIGTGYLGSKVTATVASEEATYYSLAGTVTTYDITASASSLYLDADSTTAATLADDVKLYYGYELYSDANGQWVTATTSGGSVYYLADPAASSAAESLRLEVDPNTTAGAASAWNTYAAAQVTYAVGDHTYVGTATSNSAGYYYFASTAYSDNTVYSSSTGFLVDEDGYILDDTGEKQLLTATSLYVYTQSVAATETTDAATYTYIFGESDLSVYLDEDTATDVVDDEDSSITYTYYEVQTGYKGTYYRDAYDNYVNAAGYLIDPDTLDIIYSVSDGLKAGYSFTALDGTTYIVSADAAIDVEGGTYTVYSGVATIRYYGDDNENETLDAYDTEYTSDELWIILRNELDEITSYVSVESGEEVDADTWEKEYATDTTTDSTAAV